MSPFKGWRDAFELVLIVASIWMVLMEAKRYDDWRFVATAAAGFATLGMVAYTRGQRSEREELARREAYERQLPHAFKIGQARSLVEEVARGGCAGSTWLPEVGSRRCPGCASCNPEPYRDGARRS